MVLGVLRLQADRERPFQVRLRFREIALERRHPPEVIERRDELGVLRAGDLRLRDFDGDGLAQPDLGAFEATNAARAPGEATGLVWNHDKVTLTWTAAIGAARYHAYRDDLATLSYGHFASCRDELDANHTDTQWVDGDLPAARKGFSYLVSAVDGGGNEGTLGVATSAERSNFTRCP